MNSIFSGEYFYKEWVEIIRNCLQKFPLVPLDLAKILREDKREFLKISPNNFDSFCKTIFNNNWKIDEIQMPNFKFKEEKLIQDCINLPLWLKVLFVYRLWIHGMFYKWFERLCQWAFDWDLTDREFHQVNDHNLSISKNLSLN
jgi:hypothetical protein